MQFTLGSLAPKFPHVALKKPHAPKVHAPPHVRSAGKTLRMKSLPLSKVRAGAGY